MVSTDFLVETATERTHSSVNGCELTPESKCPGVRDSPGSHCARWSIRYQNHPSRNRVI